MDSDFEEQCKEISRARKQRAESPSRFAPEFVHTKHLDTQTASSEVQAQQRTETSKDLQAVVALAPHNEIETKHIHQTSAGVCDTNSGSGLRKRMWKFGGSNSENSRAKKRRTSWARGFIKAKSKKIVRRMVSTFPPHTTNGATSSTNASAESSCTSLIQDMTSPNHKDDGVPWRIDEAIKAATKEFNSGVNHVSKNGLTVMNGDHIGSTSLPTLLSDVGQAKTESSNEDNQDVNQAVNRSSTPMSSHCQSVSESFIEDNLIENDGVDDLTSFCDGASQDDASEVNNKQNNNLCSLNVDREIELSKRKVEINADELKHLLANAVKITKRCQVETLIELYIQLNKCVVRHSKSWIRKTLPQELEKELRRFEEHSNSTAN